MSEEPDPLPHAVVRSTYEACRMTAEVDAREAETVVSTPIHAWVEPQNDGWMDDVLIERAPAVPVTQMCEGQTTL